MCLFSHDGALKLERANSQDFKEFVPLIFAAVGGSSEWVNTLYPHNGTQEGQKRATERLLDLKSIDPSIRWYKASDTKTGEIVAVSQWHVYQDVAKPKEDVCDGPPGTWESELEREYAQALFRSFMADRWAAIRENELPIVCLNIMTVAPAHQRRGAGRLLCEWGTGLADEINALCTVEASEAGASLYKKCGFREVERRTSLEVPKKFKDRPKAGLIFMIRPRKDEASVGDGPISSSVEKTS